MQSELASQLAAAIKDLYGQDVRPELTRPDEQFGDYSTNVAMQLAQEAGKEPREIAEQLVARLEGYKAEIAGPGFINFWLPDKDLAAAAASAVNIAQTNKGKEILVEFGDPNPFKEMHIGHAYSYIVGDAISSILEASGAQVRRLSYHGDVGLHVAKTIWGAQQHGGFGEDDRAIGQCYAEGAAAYEADPGAKDQIDAINKKIYDRSDSEINKLYDEGKATSFKYFDQLIAELGVPEARRFLESESGPAGLELVKANTGKVFEESDGAIVYKGEKAGLHTRVFITSAGLPTYETKDLGLARLKKEAYPGASRSIIVTAHEQAEYFKVMLAAMHEFDPATAEATTHLYHGFVSLSSGKMSSREGNVYGAKDLIEDVSQATTKQFGETNPGVRNASIKYGFLKSRLGSDIVYDVAESLSLEGNSGPYLQYAHARACSILSKASKSGEINGELDEHERSLARKISAYPEVFASTAEELMPSHICTYLYELAQNFNRFYEHSRIIGDEREGLRLGLVSAYRDVLAHGLSLLNIEAPERI